MKHEFKAIINAQAQGFIKALDGAWSSVKSFTKNTKDRITSMASSFRQADKAVKDVDKSLQKADGTTRAAGNAVKIIGDSLKEAGKNSSVLSNIGDGITKVLDPVNAVTSAFKIGMSVIRTYAEASIQAAKETAEEWKNTADAIASGRTKTATTAKETDGYAKRLAELTRKESLSNAEKVEQLELLKKLGIEYSAFSETIRKNGGRIDEAIASKIKSDYKKDVSALKAEIRALEEAKKIQDDLAETWSGYWHGVLWQGKARDTAAEASRKSLELTRDIVDKQLELHKLQQTNPETDFRRRRQAEQEDEKIELNKSWQETQDAAIQKLDEADADLHLDDFEKKRDAVRKKYEELGKTLKYNREALARIADLQAEELAKIDKEEADKRADEAKKKAAAEEAAEKKVADARKKYLEAEKSLRKSIADERIAQAKKAADAEIRQLERVRRRIERQKGRFGFTLDINPDETPSEARKRRKTNAIDASIADKQQRQREGERVHYTRQERARIGQYRDLQKQGKQVDARIKELEAAKKQQEAAEQAKASSERIAEAAKKQQEAATELQEAAKALKALRGENAEGEQPERQPQRQQAKPGQKPPVQPQRRQAKPGQKPPVQPQRRQAKPGQKPPVQPQRRQPVNPQRPMSPIASAVRFAPNYTPQLAAILQSVNSLKANTYIIK